MAILEEENAQNSCRHNTTKYIPKEVFSNKEQIINNNIKENMINSQKNVNNNIHKIDIGSYIIMSNVYIKQGKKLNLKFNAIGVRNIPGIIVDNKGFENYKIKILINYDDLIVNNIYEVNYKLVKQTSKEVCDTLIKDYEKNDDVVKFELNHSKIIENKKDLDDNNNQSEMNDINDNNFNKNLFENDLDSEHNADEIKKNTNNINIKDIKFNKKELLEQNIDNLALEKINYSNNSFDFDKEDIFSDALEYLFN